MTDCRTTMRLESRAGALELRRVGPADEAGIVTVASLHMELLSFGPMAGLGEVFIREAIYRPQISDGLIEAVVYFVDGEPAGFVAYTDRAITFHREALRRHWLRAAAVLAWSVASQPRRIARVLRSLRVLLSRRAETRIGADPMAEVVCVAVRPKFLTAPFARATGRRVSEDLIRFAADRLRERGLHELRMLVDADNRGVLLLYHALGARFERYEQAGERMFNVWFDLRRGPLAKGLSGVRAT
jgi:ribosomal protein S18 acetylase RimI-like enzyme